MSLFYFFILNCTIKLSFSLFLDLNQRIIAMMDNFSVVQVIEIIPELRLKYMGFYPSDKVPQLTKYYCVVLNSAPSKNREEHCFMIPRIN